MSKFGSSRHTFPMMTMTGPLAFREQKELIQGYLLAVASGRFKDWSVKSETFEAFLPLPEHAYPIDQDDTARTQANSESCLRTSKWRISRHRVRRTGSRWSLTKSWCSSARIPRQSRKAKGERYSA